MGQKISREDLQEGLDALSGKKPARDIHLRSEPSKKKKKEKEINTEPSDKMKQKKGIK